MSSIPVRRLERRRDVIESLSRLHGFRISRTLDLASYESEARFLEGTGSIVYDHLHRTAYAGVSLRTDAGRVDDLAGVLGYDPVIFHATDSVGRAIYHTNVVMSIGTDFAVVCADAIADETERGHVLELLRATGRRLILIDRRQMSMFGANVLELEDREGVRVVAMSDRARSALRAEQLAALEEQVQVLSSPIPTIEAVGGGSVRCMIAEVFLPRT